MKELNRIDNMPKGYFYVFGQNGNDKNGVIQGVPQDCSGTVFMGPCKPDIRSKVKPRDWIIGISNALIKPRKILSIIEVDEKLKLYKAIEKYPQAIWRKNNHSGHGQIYYKVKEGITGEPTEDDYELIDGCPHNQGNERDKAKRYHNDLKRHKDTDTLVVGTSNSCILDNYGREIDDAVLGMLRKGYSNPDKECPFGRNSDNHCQGHPQLRAIELTRTDISYLKHIIKKTKNLLMVLQHSHRATLA